MASVGQIVAPTPTREVLSRAQARAALIPDCMVEAQRLFEMRTQLIATARQIDEGGASLMRLS